MTVEHFNSVGGYSVGIPPVEIIDADGNVIAPSVTANTVVANTSISAPQFVGDLHGTLYGNVVGTVSSQAVANISHNMPSGLALGSLWFDPVDNVMKVYYSLGESLPQWVPIVLKQSILRYTFDLSTRWLVNHNKNTTQFRETLLDIDGKRFNARVNIIDANSFEVLMTESVAGHVDVIFG